MNLYKLKSYLPLILCVLYCSINPTEQYITALTLGFEKICVKLLNTVRMHYQVANLTISVNITRSAQNYAERLANLDDGLSVSPDLFECGKGFYDTQSLSIGDSATPLCGENLARLELFPNMNCRPEFIIKMWESENLFYSYENPPSDIFTRAFVSHFTQMVWRDSRYVGFGVAVSLSGRSCYVVSRYWPAGNIVGRYYSNILPARASYLGPKNDVFIVLILVSNLITSLR